MNPFALVAASAAGVLFIGCAVGAPLASPTPMAAPPTPTRPTARLATPEPTSQSTATLAPTADLTPAPSPFALRLDSDGLGIYVTIPEGWEPTGGPGNGIVGSRYLDDVALIAWFRGGGWIYGDPCHWSTTTPDTDQTTVDEIIAAFANQASRNASEVREITAGGHAGKSITLHVPADIAFDRSLGGDGGFTECDRGKFGTMTGGEGGVPESEPGRWQQGPGQIDEYWVVDVDGVVVPFDLTYWPDTPQDAIDDMRAMVESATFSPMRQ
jgi:hypothetical protein